MDLNTSHTALGESQFEVVLQLTLTAKIGEKTAYIVEVQQAGIFVVRNFDENRQGQMLGAYCPNVLFPYAREVVSDLVAKGSFPQMILQPLNFEALYQQQREKQQSGDGEPSTVQ